MIAIVLLTILLSGNLVVTDIDFPRGGSFVCTELHELATGWKPKHCWYGIEQDTEVRDDRWPNMPKGKYEGVSTWWNWQGQELKSEVVEFEVK